MEKLNELRAGLLDEIERVAWMDESDEEIVNSIRGLLYQWSQIQDHVTEDMFGDDDRPVYDPDAEVPIPNMRRC